MTEDMPARAPRRWHRLLARVNRAGPKEDTLYEISDAELAAAKARSGNVYVVHGEVTRGGEPTVPTEWSTPNETAPTTAPTTPDALGPWGAADGPGVDHPTPGPAGTVADGLVSPGTDPLAVPQARPLEVPEGLTFALPQARLLAEGWVPPVDGLALVIRQIDTLRYVFIAKSRESREGPPHIGAAIYSADREALAAAIASIGIGLWLNAELGRDSSDVYEWSRKLYAHLYKLCFDHQRLLLDSLAGWDTPSAESMRVLVRSFEGHVVCPEPARELVMIYPTM